jgi:NAD(P)-dependent dehydrogenase (short-subunit alcohol dehydrogenase family)
MNMLDKTYEKAVLVTGAGGGLGVPTVAAFAERGYLVYAGVRSLAGHPGLDRAGVRLVQLDVTDPASVAAAAARIADERGAAGLQVLVNNAGVIVQGPLELVPDDELHRQFDVNVYGPARVLRAVLPLLRSGGGRVINISAVSARAGLPFNGPIAASKSALELLSDATRVELAPWRIPVVVIELAAVETDIFAKAEIAARDSLAQADPARVALYREQLAAVARATANQSPGSADRVVRVILRAAHTRRPRPRYVAGLDARMFTLILRLPARTRDRMLSRVLGLSKVAPRVGVLS